LVFYSSTETKISKSKSHYFEGAITTGQIYLVLQIKLTVHISWPTYLTV